MRKIAVEEGISNAVMDTLKKQGYEIVSPYRGQNVDVIITTGLDNNVMNMQDISTKAPVIDASGKTPEEILKRVKELRFS